MVGTRETGARSGPTLGELQDDLMRFEGRFAARLMGAFNPIVESSDVKVVAVPLIVNVRSRLPTLSSLPEKESLARVVCDVASDTTLTSAVVPVTGVPLMLTPRFASDDVAFMREVALPSGVSAADAVANAVRRVPIVVHTDCVCCMAVTFVRRLS